MSAVDRQNRLLVAEDWRKIYQSIQNVDFQSYDYENLRRSMIDYLRQNYPEDFNDYVESSEYMALINMIASLGQSIAFRVDLNSRENFIDLAERRDNILRLSRLVGYNAKRNIAGNGLLKFVGIQTTEAVYDTNGRNLANQFIGWNDSTNTNWYDQFMKVMNAAMPLSQQFGNPSDVGAINGIRTEQYRIASSDTAIPIYEISKNISGRVINFEITSTTFNGEQFIYEDAPRPANPLGFVYRNDNQGYGSPASGFFLRFTQGSLGFGSFEITSQKPIEIVDINTTNINNTDVWLSQIGSSGLVTNIWKQVPSVLGNNVIYNNLPKANKNIFSVLTRTDDKISLQFGDGTFGNIPSGKFRVYYRTSNGMYYTVKPKDIRDTAIKINYITHTGQVAALTVYLSLMTSVSNSAPAETDASVKANAPATYYTQNRMITGEDYNISPISVNHQVLKVKSLNRTSSGISRYFDLTDPTGKYSSTNIFGDDGILFNELTPTISRFNYNTKADIERVFINQLLPIMRSAELKNFYFAKFVTPISPNLKTVWHLVKTDIGTCSGSLKNSQSELFYKVGSYTGTELKTITSGAMIKFVTPVGYKFNTADNNTLVQTTNNLPNLVDHVWVKVINVKSDGSGSGTGKLLDGTGPIIVNAVIPNGALISKVIPKFKATLDSALQVSIIDLIFNNKQFGLRYDAISQTWKIVNEPNVSLHHEFTLSRQGDDSNTALDSSWLISFTTDNEYYTITTRGSRFVFESDKKIRFYYDKSEKIYDNRSNTIVKDTINLLSVNLQPDIALPFTKDLKWEVVSEYIGIDGNVDDKKLVVSFSETDDGISVIDPELFTSLVEPDTNPLTKYVVQEKYTVASGQDDYRYFDNANNTVIIKLSENGLDLTNYSDGQYFYFVDTDTVKTYAASKGYLIPSRDYKVFVGRDHLKFQYLHNSNYESRIDPGTSNIIDVYVLTKEYDLSYRQYLAGLTTDNPFPPTTEELNTMLSPSLNMIKAISDEIVYHPVTYKTLFGQSADLELQAIFKITKTPGRNVSDNDVKSRALVAINQFFNIENWDFGDTFYFSELAAYVMTQLSPDISNFIIVPRKPNLTFGNLYEIKALDNQLFVNGTTASDIEIISGITMTNIKS